MTTSDAKASSFSSSEEDCPLYFSPLGRLQEAEALCQDGFRLVETGDVRLELPLRIQFAYTRLM